MRKKNGLKKVWLIVFSIKNGGKLTNLYLKSDVTL